MSNFEEICETKRSGSKSFYFLKAVDFEFFVVLKGHDIDKGISQSVIFEEVFAFRKSSFESFNYVKKTVFAFFVPFLKSRTSI